MVVSFSDFHTEHACIGHRWVKDLGRIDGIDFGNLNFPGKGQIEQMMVSSLINCISIEKFGKFGSFENIFEMVLHPNKIKPSTYNEREKII